ncbi:hypothetical protein [Corynebacterium sp. MSK019]|nr:hypothetical protein [Corynebacterium sp. MSK019]MDK8850824.1 hypothetical protein [Corynebacterium sp. MSK019]
MFPSQHSGHGECLDIANFDSMVDEVVVGVREAPTFWQSISAYGMPLSSS